ncbi:MAG: COQ9 family protein [Alphaproteobacteria bacterium]
MTESDQDQRRRDLLTAALPHVPFDGWSRAALIAGAKDLGLSGAEVERAFPAGPIDAIRLFSALADERMVAVVAGLAGTEMRLRDRIVAGIRARLEDQADHKDQVRKGMGVLALPQYAAVGAKCLYNTVNQLWYAAGDSSTDHNFYTKRALLTGVYGATVLFWLSDGSAGHARTWEFLGRRIDDALRIPKAALQGLEALRHIPTAIPNPIRLARSLGIFRQLSFHTRRSVRF